MSEPTLDFTGERFTPECVREIWYEHWHRYAFALPLSPGRRVLDVACGEGYGSALLARGARHVTAIDLAAEAVEHARVRYGAASNLRFECGDATALDHLPDASFDLIASFETLEHVEAQERMLDGFARLLAPGGLLLVSTPDRATYSDASGFRNEYHVRELYRSEFEALLDARFPHRRLFGQKLLFQSVLWDLAATGRYEAAAVGADDVPTTGLSYSPLYYVAACARESGVLEALPALSLFGDRDESVYAHYNAEIRKNIGAGHRILELEQALARAQADNAELRARIDARAR